MGGTLSINRGCLFPWPDVRPARLAEVRRDRLPRAAHDTECIYELVLESQLPHKIFNLLLTIADQNVKLTFFWGGVTF